MSAIKIPSFRIYDKENDKYIDNVVVSIDYNGVAITTNIVKNEDSGVSYESPIGEGDIDANPVPWELSNTIIGQYSPLYGLRVDYMRYWVYSTPNLTISFPRSQNNNKKYILSIDTGYKTEGEENIPYTAYSATGTKTTGNCNVDIAFQYNHTSQGIFGSIYSSTFPTTFVGAPAEENIEVSIDDTLTKSYNNISFFGGNTLSASVLDKNFEYGLSSQVTWEIDDNDNIVIHNIQVPVAYSFWYPRDVSNSNIDNDPDLSTTLVADGTIITGHFTYTLEKFVPTSFTLGIRATYRDVEEEQISSKYPFNSTAASTLSIEGNTFSSATTYVCKEGIEYANTNEDVSYMLGFVGYDSTDGSYGVRIYVNNSYKSDFSSPITVFNTSNGGREFIGFIKRQNGGLSVPNITEDKFSFVAYKCITLFDYASADIYNKWKDGKETATLRVSINNYYDENYELIKSINNDNIPMLFANDDIVIPYVATPSGDRPMSLKPDGSPKSFRVTGVTLVDDGALWQELQLQEVSS